MKKILFLLFAFTLSIAGALAQEISDVTLISETNATATDTVTNTGVKIVATPSTPGFWDLAGVFVTVTKISGTVAGVVRLVGSYDGTNFFRIAPTDSLNAANVTSNYKSFTLTSYPYKYIGVQYTGTGTMAAKLNATTLFKRAKR